MGGRAGGEGKSRVLAHLLHGDGGRFGAWLLDLGGGVALLIRMARMEEECTMVRCGVSPLCRQLQMY